MAATEEKANKGKGQSKAAALDDGSDVDMGGDGGIGDDDGSAKKKEKKR